MAIKSGVKSGRRKLRGGEISDVLYSIGRFFKNLAIALGFLIAAALIAVGMIVFAYIVVLIFG